MSAGRMNDRTVNGIAVFWLRRDAIACRNELGMGRVVKVRVTVEELQ